MHDVLLVCPQRRDRAAIEAAGLAARFRLRELGTDLDVADGWERLDTSGLLAGAAPLAAEGVLGTKDASALIAALVAEPRNLPGPTPAAMLNCQLKHRSRLLQAAAAPAATPRFSRLPTMPRFPPPYFVKPVVGRLSQDARRIERRDELAGLPQASYAHGFSRLAAAAGVEPDEVEGYLVEELLTGDEVTLEGYVHEGRVVTLGITDSVKYPGTNSFQRFEYPSALPESRQAELRRIAERVLPALGFDGGVFNIELFVPAAGPAAITEVNGRLASQFAPLYLAVHGRSNYEPALELACGLEPSWAGGGAADGVAISFCLRAFEDAWVEVVPPAEDGLELLCAPERLLSQQGTNDAQSYRLCIFSAWAPTREQAVERSHARAAQLRASFRLRPPDGRA